MTTKRFTWLKKDVYAPQIVITDSLTEEDLTPTDCYELLNELAEENEQLRFDFKEMKELLHSLEDEIKKFEKENKELIQFKEQVFNLIDKKLEENKELDGVDTAMYYTNKQTLNELKKELEE